MILERLMKSCATAVLLVSLVGCGGAAALPSGAARDFVARAAPLALANENLLYVSEYGGGVLDVFSWPKGQYITSLTGLNDTPAMGLCVDKKGDIWVVESVSGAGHPQAQKFSHIGAPIGDLQDQGEDPYGCAVDPKSGDFAMTSEEGLYNQPGSVEVWKNASGTATVYTDYPSIDLMLWCGYDDKGNLFVDGIPGESGSEFQLAELPRGGKSLINIKTSGIVFPGSIQWTHGMLTIGDPSYESGSVIHQLQISGRTAKSVGLTVLKQSQEVFQGWIQGDMVIGPEDSHSFDGVQLWKYPKGGNPTATLSKGRSGYFNGPIGAAVSLVK